MELMRVGKRLELQGTGIFVDLWPQVLSFCGRGWFEVEEDVKPTALDFSEERSIEASDSTDDEDSDESDEEA